MAKGIIKVNKKGIISIRNIVINGQRPFIKAYKIKKQSTQDNESKITIKIDVILKTPKVLN